MKIAFLITAFSNYNHLRRLVMALDDHRVQFYIHIDKKSDMPDNLCNPNVNFIKRRKVWWGGWSHTQAILDLMGASQDLKPDYHVLLSGADYPIRPNRFLYNLLESGGEFINIIKGFHEHKPEDRIRFHYFDNFDRRDPGSRRTIIFKKLEEILKKVYKKKSYPFTHIYHGSTWWALSGTTVNYILNEINQNPELVNFFKTSWCPEESLIPTIIGNSHIKSRCCNYLTFTDWSTNPAPARITRNHVEMFQKNTKFENVYGSYTPFFARKFDDNSIELIKQIEKDLRNTEK